MTLKMSHVKEEQKSVIFPYNGRVYERDGKCYRMIMVPTKWIEILPDDIRDKLKYVRITDHISYLPELIK